MADEREDSGVHAGQPANEDKIQTGGRKENAAQPLNSAKDHGGAERYPSGESRSFDPSAEAPTPRQGAGDGGAPDASSQGRLGPGGDPAEGKR